MSTASEVRSHSPTQWSGSELRSRASTRGGELGHYQAERYRGWGLLDPEGLGYYTELDLDRLDEIRSLGALRPYRQLSRRTLRLRITHWSLFRTPPKRVREAMIELVAPRTFRAPKRKWNQIVRASRTITGELEAQLEAAQGEPFQSMVPRMLLSQPKVRPMSTDLHCWTKLLKGPALSDADFDQVVALSAHTDAINQLRPYWPRDDKIPVEERVTMLTVWNLHYQQQLGMRGVGRYGRGEVVQKIAKGAPQDQEPVPGSEWREAPDSPGVSALYLSSESGSPESP